MKWFCRFLGALMGVAGLLIAFWTVSYALDNLDTPPQLVEPPENAVHRTQAMMDALMEGEFSAASTYMLGNPDLGADREASDTVGVMIWEAFMDSLEYSFTSELYATEDGLSRNVSVESLDIASVTANLKQRAQDLLTQRVEAAEDVEQIYTDEGEYREDFVMEVLRDAVTAALAEDAKTIHRELTLNLIYENGQWWILPDQALLEAISGGIAG